VYLLLSETTLFISLIFLWNSNEAINEVQLDINEGADVVIIKPALSYLDIIYKIKERFNIPIIAYNVSGEY
jgi:porphobilinogen synthase